MDAPLLNPFDNQIKMEEGMDSLQPPPRLEGGLQSSWDSGVVLDTNTVVQMAEFQGWKLISCSHRQEVCQQAIAGS